MSANGIGYGNRSAKLFLAAILICLAALTAAVLAPVQHAYAANSIQVTEDTEWNDDKLSAGGRWTITIAPDATLTLNATQSMKDGSVVVINGGGTILRGPDCTDSMFLLEDRTACELTINNITVDGNAGMAPTDSIIKITGGDNNKITLKGTTQLINNLATEGGAFYVSTSVANHYIILQDDVRIYNNQAVRGGAVFYNCDPGSHRENWSTKFVSFTLKDNAQICGNEATQGGAFYVNNGNLPAGAVTTTGNACIGGDTLVEANVAERGGAFYMERANWGDMYFKDVTIKGNRAVTSDGTGVGGAIYIEDWGYASGDGSTVVVGDVDELFPMSIGADYSVGAATVSNARIIGNTADFGGAIGVRNDDDWRTAVYVNICDGSVLEDNDATYDGGAVFMSSEQTWVSAAVYRANSSGLFLYVNDATIRGNAAGRDGGGIFMQAGKAPEFRDTDRGSWLFVRSTAQITGNTAGRNGGGVCSVTIDPAKHHSRVELYGMSNITGNTAVLGGGVYTNENLKVYESPKVTGNTDTAGNDSNIYFANTVDTKINTYLVIPTDNDGDLIPLSSNASLGVSFASPALGDIALTNEDGTNVSVGNLLSLSSDDPDTALLIDTEATTGRNVVIDHDGPSGKRVLSSFSVAGSQGVVDEATHTVSVEVPFEVNINENQIATFTVSEGATVRVGDTPQESGVTGNIFNTPVVYTVVAENGRTQDYTVTVTKALPSLAFVDFSVKGYDATIDHDTRTVYVTLPYGSTATGLSATFTTTPGATVTVNGVEQVTSLTTNDFTEPVVYTLTNGDETVDYTVFITVATANPGTVFSVDIPFVPTDPEDTSTTVPCRFKVTNDGTNGKPRTASVTTTPYTSQYGTVLWQVGGVDTATDGAITIPRTVTYEGEEYLVTSLDVHAFYECGKLTSITLPDTIESIGAVAFGYNYALTELTIPAAVTNVEVQAMYQANNLTTIRFKGDLSREEVFFNRNAFNGANALRTFIFEDKKCPHFAYSDIDENVYVPIYQITNYYRVTFYGSEEDAIAGVNPLGYAQLVDGTLLGDIAEGYTEGLYEGEVPALPAGADAWGFEGDLGAGNVLEDSLYAYAISSNADNQITSFSIDGVEATIDQDASTVSLSLPYGASLTSLKPVFTLSKGASASVDGVPQVSGTSINDFTTPVTYTVMASNGAERDYTVTVSYLPNTEAQITAYSLAGVPGEVNRVRHTVALTLPEGTSVSSLAANFALSDEATAYVNGVKQTSGVTKNNFKNPVTYTVVAGDGTEVQWTVTVTVEGGAPDDPDPEPIDLSTGVIEPIADQTWTGEALTPPITVTLDGEPVPTTGYDVVYTDNTDVGTATVTVTGKGDYNGSLTATFQIVPSEEPPVPAVRQAIALAGSNRYATAAAFATEAYPLGSDYVIVACGENFPDALSASGLAGLLDCPIILTAGSSLSPEAAAAIEQLGCTEVVAVGGVVSVPVCTAIRNTGDVAKVTRLAGVDRFDTCRLVYEYGCDVAGGWENAPIIVSGKKYPDALSIAPYAFARKAPVILVGDSLTSDLAQAISNASGKQAIIVGDENSVSGPVADTVKQLTGVEPLRLGGIDRFDTSAQVAAFCIEQGMKADGLTVATGTNFPDALAAGPLCGSNNTVMLLSSSSACVAADAVVPLADTVNKMYFAGGLNAVTLAAREDAMARLGGGFERVNW